MVSEEKIRQNLIRLRKEHKMTQEDIAGQLNMSRTGYAAFEQGYAIPSIITLGQISKLYNISLGKLIGEEKEGDDQS